MIKKVEPSKASTEPARAPLLPASLDGYPTGELMAALQTLTDAVASRDLGIHELVITTWKNEVAHRVAAQLVLAQLEFEHVGDNQARLNNGNPLAVSTDDAVNDWDAFPKVSVLGPKAAEKYAAALRSLGCGVTVRAVSPPTGSKG